MTDCERKIKEILKHADSRNVQPRWLLWCLERGVEFDNEDNVAEEFVVWLEQKKRRFRELKDYMPNESIDPLSGDFDQWLEESVVTTLCMGKA